MLSVGGHCIGCYTYKLKYSTDRNAKINVRMMMQVVVVDKETIGWCIFSLRLFLNSEVEEPRNYGVTTVFQDISSNDSHTTVTRSRSRSSRLVTSNTLSRINHSSSYSTNSATQPTCKSSSLGEVVPKFH